MIVVYKFGTRLGGQLSPKEGLKVHLLHAEAHAGKVLFTTSKAPSVDKRDDLEGIIMTTADGSFAISAKINDMQKFIVRKPSSEYTIPSLWTDEKQDSKAWFALSDVKKIEGGIHRGDYECVTGKDLLDSISGNAYMVYIK